MDKNELSCPNCKHQFDYHSTDRIPKYLSCLHTLCEQCITELNENKDPYDSVCCPLCNKTTTIETEDNITTNLPINFRMYNSFPRSKLCDNCEIKMALIVCQDCAPNCSQLCAGCSVTHKKFKAFRDHRLVDMPLQSPGDESDDKGDIRIPPCSKHPMKALSDYCVTCRRTVCQLCIVDDDHSSHDVLSHAEGALLERQKLQESLSTLQLSIDSYQQTQLHINHKLSFLNEQKSEVIEEARESFRSLSSKLNQQHENLLTSLGSQSEKNHQSIQNRIARISSLVSLCERFVTTVAEYEDMTYSETVDMKRLLSTTYQNILSEYKLCSSPILPVAYNDGTSKVVGDMIPKYVPCCNDGDKLSLPDYYTFDVILNGNFTAGSWRVVLLLKTRESAAGKSIVLPNPIQLADISICVEVIRSREKKDVQNVSEKVQKQKSVDIKNEPKINFVVNIVDNCNGTFYVSASTDEIQLLKGLDCSVSISMKIFGIHVKNSPYTAIENCEAGIGHSSTSEEEDTPLNNLLGIPSHAATYLYGFFNS